MTATESAYAEYCTQRFPLPSDLQVASLEARLDATLPPHFREYILRFNGGYFSEPNIQAPSPDCPSDRLSVLWGIGSPEPFAELGHDTDLFDDNFPTQVLPIGYTMMGNLLLVITGEGDDNGRVLMKRKFSADYYWLADSMADFFQLLKPTATE